MVGKNISQQKKKSWWALGRQWFLLCTFGFLLRIVHHQLLRRRRAHLRQTNRRLFRPRHQVYRLRKILFQSQRFPTSWKLLTLRTIQSRRGDQKSGKLALLFLPVISY